MTRPDPPEMRVRLNRWVLAAYAAPAFSQTLIHGPTGSVIQGVYAKYFNVPLNEIALVLLGSSFFDAAMSPVAGYLSDRYCANGGTRKPWVLGGSIISAIACWFLFAPSTPVTTLYFLIVLLLTYASWAIVEVPYSAWMAEITADYNERTRLATWRGVAMYGGTIAFAAIPYLPLFPSTDFTPASLRATAVVAAIVLPLFAIIAVSSVPASRVTTAFNSRSPVWRGIVTNGPLMGFALLFFLYNLASGAISGLLYFYLDSHLHQGQFMAGLFLLALPVSALAVPLWGSLCRRYGKQRAWASGVAGTALAVGLYAIVPAGGGGTPWLILVQVLIFVLFAGFPVAAPAILADVIDYGRLRYDMDYGGTYFSIYNIMYKAVPGMGAALAIALVQRGGFDVHLAQQTAGGTASLLWVFCALPALLLAIAAPLLWFFPIDARRQQIIRRRLALRQSKVQRRPDAESH